LVSVINNVVKLNYRPRRIVKELMMDEITIRLRWVVVVVVVAVVLVVGGGGER